jgi:hypothetical protein
MTLLEKTGDASIRLWKKFYLVSILLFGTVGGFFGLLYGMQDQFGFGHLQASFITFLIIIFVRGILESLLIHDVSWNTVQFKKLLLLSVEGSVILAPLLYLLKIPFGAWSVLIAVGCSSQIIRWLKKKNFPQALQNDSEAFSKILAKKLPLYNRSLCGFFIALGLLTYGGLWIWGISNFSTIFSWVLFITLLAHMILEWTSVYKRPLRRPVFLAFLAGAVGGTLITSWLIGQMLDDFGWPGKASTICGMIILKLTQPWLTKWLLQS